MLYTLSIIFGSLIGFALGLTGGGGSLLAVPLLVYGLSVAPREAVGISLAAVGATALAGLIARMRSGNVEFGTGALFAAAGMLGAPFGAWAAQRIPETVLLTLFASLMLLIGINMWRTSSRTDESRAAYHGLLTAIPRCERSETGALRLTTPCALLLLLAGLATGVFSGLFGVGGGIVIVPALVMFSKMPIHRAVGTSLLVIALISVSGVTSHLITNRDLSLDLTGLFIAGGLLGLAASHRVARRISGPRLQKVFAAGIFVVALSIIVRELY